MKALASFKHDERSAQTAPFVDKVCKVIYRAGSYGKYDREIVGRIIGSSWHSTNGNSSGDLIVAPATRGRVFAFNGEHWNTTSIALVHIRDIVPVED